ncbi:MAG: hypothetical protein ABEH88_05685 [Halobacteriales archaeon]
MILVMTALAFLPAANVGLWPLLIVSGSLGFFVFLQAPVNQELVSKHAPLDLRGLSFGWTYAGVFGIGAFGSAVAGEILSLWSVRILFVVLATFAVLGGALGVFLDRRTV